MKRAADPRTAHAWVYSTEGGRMCPQCRRPLTACTCKAATGLVGTGQVRVWLETKGRGGKGVTVAKGFALDAEALARLGKELKAVCGSGGTVKDGAVEIQGDHRDRVIEQLQQRGMAVKRAGG